VCHGVSVGACKGSVCAFKGGADKAKGKAGVVCSVYDTRKLVGEGRLVCVHSSSS